ncbi:LuxR C-terminal-related transcriptional regulator [Streptosporangium sp. NPDC000396]|uniref:LuxR C-terminal-related transcriptional regulator n=1 Tax=Streptosporangium sp. NPDC000396 TaxID=3366185 RepID=UPI0036CF2484
MFELIQGMRLGDLGTAESAVAQVLACDEAGRWSKVAARGQAAKLAWIRGDTDWTAHLDRQRVEAAGDHVAEVIAGSSTALLLAASGWIREGRAALEAAERRLHQVGIAELAPSWELAALTCEWVSGDWIAAERRSRGLERLPPYPAVVTLSLRIDLLRELGLPEAAWTASNRLDEAQARLIPAAWALAGLDAFAGDHGRALDRLTTARRAATREARPGLLPLLLHRTAALACDAGEHAVAREAWAGFVDVRRSAPMTQMLAGLTEAYATGHPEPARRALRLARAHGARAIAAECLTVRARLGEGPASAADAAWAAVGAAARRSSVRLAQPPGTRDARLTPREHELVRLVHAGRTNRQIAAHMRLSVKTVEAYLTRIYVKTGCRSRVELALSVAREPTAR